MAKDKTQFVCSECGGISLQWLGKCPHCGEWNTLEETASASAAPSKHRYAQSSSSLAPASQVQPLNRIQAADIARHPTGHDELDRVLGGGVVPGGVVLIGGDPGIGKSTLLLQALDGLQRAGLSTLYVTGEESAAQVSLRAQRLGLGQSDVPVMAETQLEVIQATVHAQKPQLVVIDSIQTVFSDQLSSAPGSVAQVRECAAMLTRMAKRDNVTVVLVGHVTKRARWRGHEFWSTWSTPCCISRATRIPATA